MSDDRRVTTSIRMGQELYEQLRAIAFEKRVSMHSLIIEGAKDIAATYQAQPSGSAPHPTTATTPAASPETATTTAVF